MNFDDNFFNAIGMGQAAPEQKEKIGEQIAELVQNRMAIRLAEVLTEEQADQFGGLLERGEEEQAFAYLEQIYPEYNQIVQEEVDRVKDDMVRNMQGVIEQVNQAQTQAQGQPQAVEPPEQPAQPEQQS